VYDADGGVLGELRYALGKLFAKRHCSLCDLTHRGVRHRPEWVQMVSDLGVPFRLLHRNEMDEEVRAATEGRLPAVLARRANRLELLMGPDALDACAADPSAFEQRLRGAVGPDDPSGRR
jgi:hypothetical protein